MTLSKEETFFYYKAQKLLLFRKYDHQQFFVFYALYSVDKFVNEQQSLWLICNNNASTEKKQQKAQSLNLKRMPKETGREQILLFLGLKEKNVSQTPWKSLYYTLTLSIVYCVCILGQRLVCHMGQSESLLLVTFFLISYKLKSTLQSIFWKDKVPI